jgi:hypothetical protein
MRALSQLHLVRMLIASLLWAACGASEDDNVEARCERLRQHLIDLRVQSLPQQERVAHAAALSNALGTRFTGECKTMTRSQLDCALASRETADFSSCTATKP